MDVFFDGTDSNDSVEELSLPSKKTKGKYVEEIEAKYKCPDGHRHPCLIKNGRHRKLIKQNIGFWAGEMVGANSCTPSLYSLSKNW